MRLGRTSLFHFSTQVLTSVAGFLATFVIARFLGAGVLGQFASATALVVVLGIPYKTIAGAMNKRISERQEPDKYLTAGLVLVFVVTLIPSGVLILGSSLVTEYLGASVVGLVVLYLASNALFSVYTAVLTGEKKVVASGALNTLEHVLRFFFQFGLILLGYKLAGLLVGQVLSLLIAVGIGVAVSDLSIHRPTVGHFRRLFDFAKYTWMNQIKGRSFSWMDVLILGVFVESTFIGIYEVSWTLASVLILVSQSVQQTLFPEMSELGVEGNYERVHHLLNEGLVFVGIFAIPGLFGAAIIGAELLTVYRPVFGQGQPVLLLLIVARLLDAYASQFISVLGALDHPEQVFRVGLVFTVSNVVLNITLIWQYGWIGAAIATSIAAFLELGLSYAYIGGIIGRPAIPYPELVAELGAGAVMAVVIYVLTLYVPLSDYTAIGLVFVGAFVYVGLLLALSVRIRQKARALAPELPGV